MKLGIWPQAVFALSNNTLKVPMFQVLPPTFFPARNAENTIGIPTRAIWMVSTVKLQRSIQARTLESFDVSTVSSDFSSREYDFKDDHWSPTTRSHSPLDSTPEPTISSRIGAWTQNDCSILAYLCCIKCKCGINHHRYTT